jgi:hypothetical protein
VPLDPLDGLAGWVDVGAAGGGDETVLVVCCAWVAVVVDAELVVTVGAAGCEALWWRTRWMATCRRTWAGCLSAVRPGTNCAASAASVVVAGGVLRVDVAALAVF